jgi:hypothetical protein
MLVEGAVNTRRLGVLVLAGLVLNPLLPVSWAHKTDRVTVIKMEDDPNYAMVWVSCRIKGDRRRHVCVIDSGATYTIISDRVLEAQGPPVRVTTGNGVIRGHQREVSLTIAEGLDLKSKATVQSMMPEGVDILVGQDILRQFRFVIFDYQNRQIKLQK